MAVVGGEKADDVEMKDGKVGEEAEPAGYIPGAALLAAVTEWLPEFYKPKGSHPNILEEFSGLEVHLDSDVEMRSESSTSEEKRSDTATNFNEKMDIGEFDIASFLHE